MPSFLEQLPQRPPSCVRFRRRFDDDGDPHPTEVIVNGKHLAPFKAADHGATICARPCALGMTFVGPNGEPVTVPWANVLEVEWSAPRTAQPDPRPDTPKARPGFPIGAPEAEYRPNMVPPLENPNRRPKKS
jgi:hypothetical protein